MAKLNQIVAIKNGVKSRAYSVLSELNKIIEKPALFNGSVRVYQKSDDADDDLPSERQHVAYRIEDVLSQLRMQLGDLMDITTQNDAANNKAVADVMVDGQVILPSMPVGTLLFLEKQVTDLRTFISKIPVLDAAEAWTRDTNTDLMRSETVRTRRTKKVPLVVTLAEATEHHPAQARLEHQDVTAGFWEVTKLSGAMGLRERTAMLARTEKLLMAVQEAREAANDIDAGTRPVVGAKVFDFLIGRSI